MPNGPTNQQLKAWYEKFSEILLKNADIDVSKPEALGLVKNFQITKWNTTNHNTPDVNITYAYMPQGDEPADPAPKDSHSSQYQDWLRNTLKPAVTTEQIRQLYDMSQAGTLMITSPEKGMKDIQMVHTDLNGRITVSQPISAYRNGGNEKAMNGKVQIDQEGKRINPLVPGEGQVPVRDYYLNAEEKRDLDADIKKLYTEPLLPVKILGEATLEQIRGHVKLSAKVTELGQITNPMAVVKALAAQDNAEKINELVAEVNAARKHEEISKEEALLKQLQKQADELNGVHKGVEPKPENQLENSQPVAPTMN